MPNLARLSFSLGRCLIAVSLLYPPAILSTLATLIVYLYLLYEAVFNSRLIRNNPPGPDDHLPSRSEWTASGGFTKSLPPQPDSDAEEEYCSVCYHHPEDAVQIVRCEHIFCRNCLDAWLTRANRSCPQCTTNLWREEKPDGSLLERATKFLVAEGLVSIPLTIYTVYTCLSYHTSNSRDRISWRSFLFLTAFIPLSIIMLLVVREWGQLVLERRRTCGLGWWGANVGPDIEPGIKLTMLGVSQFGALWLAILSLTLQAHVDRPLLPFGYRLMLALVMLPIAERPWAYFEEHRRDVRSHEAARLQETSARDER